ncbi:hypothetical protein B7463_g10694, partial [Scytalidium lignicola]
MARKTSVETRCMAELEYDSIFDDEAVTGTLEARDNQHQCTEPGGGLNTGVYIADSMSVAAVQEGSQRAQLGYAGRAYTATGTNFYPKRFNNNENIADINFNCPGGPWFEYPVFANPLRVFGTTDFRPGADRVIFDQCGNWCATITHRGETGNAFHECYPA